MRTTILSILVFICTYALTAQDSLHPDVSELSSVDLYKLPALNNTLLQARHKKLDGKVGPLRFAEQRDVSIVPQKHGTWEQAQDNKLVWRQRILSPNAYTLNLGFTQFFLPTSAKLFIYNGDKSEIIGPLTTADNDEHMQFWSPMVRGEEIVVELQIDPDEKDDLILELSRVNHDFLDIQKSLSGSCNVDVECGDADGYPLVDNYRDIIRAVGAYTLQGLDACSGTLVNNQRNDCTPYFITADHCGIRNNSAPSIVIYWNYQNSTCRTPNGFESGRIGDGLRNQFSSGSNLKARLSNSDIALIELDDPIDPSLDLYLAGWSREYELPDTTICIHHPGVEEKRISFDFDPPVYDPTGSDTTHIRVRDWDIGTTEAGSSGSGLFNTKGQLIGQLTGGYAACGNNEWDTYGWMDFSWDKGPNASSQLQPYLDPDNTGVISIEGKSCNNELNIETLSYEVCSNKSIIEIRLQPIGAFSGNISYTVSGVPNGLEANFDFVIGSSDSENQLTISGLENIGQQIFDIEISITDGSNEVSKVVNIDVYDMAPTTPIVIGPVDMTEEAPLKVDLLLMLRDVYQNQFQVATDSNFNDIIADENVTASNFLLDNLVQNTQYFWRARSINPCGESEWSDVSTFRTTLQFCAVVHSFDDAITIDDGPASVITSTASFPYLTNISDVVVNNIIGKHSYLADLSVSLSFNGNTSALFSDICFSNDNFNLGFSDASIIDEIVCPATDGRIYKPDSPLSIFSNSAGGDWTLTIDDTADDDGGSLDSWSLNICYTNPIAPIIIPNNNIWSGCADSEISADLYVDAGAAIANYDVVVIDNLGDIVPSTLGVSNTDDNLMTLSVKPDISSSGLANVLLINADSGALEFFTTVMLDLSNSEEQPVVATPAQGLIYNFNSLRTIDWISDKFQGDYIVEISVDSNFSNIVFSSFGNGDSNIEIDVTAFEINEYFLRIGNFADCGLIYSETTRFSIDNTTILENVKNQAVTVYPNPTNGILYIQSEIDIRKSDAVIVSAADGKLHNPYMEYLSDQMTSVDISDYAGGVYFLQMTNGNRTITKRIVVIE